VRAWTAFDSALPGSFIREEGFLLNSVAAVAATWAAFFSILKDNEHRYQADDNLFFTHQPEYSRLNLARQALARCPSVRGVRGSEAPPHPIPNRAQTARRSRVNGKSLPCGPGGGENVPWVAPCVKNRESRRLSASYEFTGKAA
jgi:hypothetical protein